MNVHSASVAAMAAATLVFGAIVAACRAPAPFPQLATAPTNPVLAITVDDLPIGGADEGVASVEAINDAILRALREARAPAVGFVNEVKLFRAHEVDRRIAVLARWLDADLELGNHTFSHPDFHNVGLAVYRDEIVRGDTITRMLMKRRKKTLRWFRQTFLRTGKTLAQRDALLKFLASRGYAAAPVTLENDDWLFNSRYLVARRRGDSALMARLADAYLAHWTTMLDYYEAMTVRLFVRSIPHVALLHANQLNADHLPRVLALFRARGYAFTTLEAALADSAYRHEDRYAGRFGKSWLQRWLFTRGEDTHGKEPAPPAWVQELPAK